MARAGWRWVAAAVTAGLLVSACTDAEPEPPTAPSPSRASEPPGAEPWPRADPVAAGLRPRDLAAAARVARRAGSSCLLVAQGERVVGEWYWAGASADQPRTTFSVTKSVTSTLVGLAASDGDLALGDRAARHVPEWRGTPAAAVRVRDLLANTSGRQWSMESDYARLHEATDRTAYAVGLAQQHRPGTVWAYNNAAIQTLDAVLASATGTPTAEYARQRLFAPLGMDHTALETRGGATSTFAWMTSTCRDLARFGLLFARDGAWAGEQLVPRSFVRQAVGRPSQSMTSAYGLLWWLNRRGPVADPLEPVGPGLPGAPRAPRGQLVPGAREDVFAALGLGGQVVLVDPRTDTVVVRLGDLRPDDLDAYTVRDAAALLPGRP